MGRSQQFVGALVGLALIAAWSIHGPDLVDAWRQMQGIREMQRTGGIQ